VAGSILFGSGSSVAPGDSAGANLGILTFNNNATFNAPLNGLFQLGTADLNIGRAMPSTIASDPARAGTSDLLNVLGTLSVNNSGTVSVASGTGFAPQLGDVYDIVDAVVLGGSLSGLAFNLPALPTGMGWDTSRFADLGVLAIVPEPSRLLMLPGAICLFLLRRRR
jgi:hypothetical protein